ncbi:electron transfer flavoprotein subunit beta/FixA family protein [candidate division KSB1 bacterium]
MKIAVCMKSVPDTESRIKIVPETNWIDESDLKFIINPYDEYAIEEALKVKEAAGGEVTIISIGPERALTEVRKGLAMGADKATLLKCDRILSPFPTARALADELKEGGYDLIFFGKQAVDDDSTAVGQMVSELLDIPVITHIVKLEVKDNSITVERELQKGREVIDSSLPAIVTAEKGLNEPRYPSLKGMMMAKKITIDTKEPAFEENGIEILKIEYPPERPEGRIIGEGAEAVSELLRLLKEEAKII